MEAKISNKRGRPIKLDEKRILILNAAKQCFLEKGYDLTTLDYIAQKIGFNKSAFYYYFSDKRELFLETIQDELNNSFSIINHEKNPEYTYDFLLDFIRKKTMTTITICRLHKLKRTNALQVILSYKKNNKDLINNEKEYYKKFINHHYPGKYDEKKLFFYANLLYTTLFAFTNISFLVNYIHEDEELSKNHIEEKLIIAELFLRGL